MDRVFIEDLRADTVIGVHDWERTVRQAVSLDLEMTLDVRPAGASDRLADTLDYDAVARRLTGFIERSEFQLIEALAEACAALVLEEFPVRRLSLRLRKPGAVANSRNVGVFIERGDPE